MNSAPSDERLKLWFGFSPETDELIRREYSTVLEAAASGELDEWKQNAQGTITLIVILDQFSRQIYRKQAKAFAYDELALELAKDAVANQLDKTMHFSEKIFCYLPFQHSEKLDAQRKSVSSYGKLLDRAGESQYEFASKSLKMAREHLAIIDKFGRFPHRNEALERETTEEELNYLATEQERFGQ